MTSFTRADLARWAKNAGPASPLHDLVKSTASSPRRRRGKAGELPPSLGRSLTITVPMPESLTNSGKGRSRHYRQVAKAKRAYWEVLDFFAELGRIPAPPSPAIGIARVTSVMYLGNRMDADNAMARHKWVLDWLQNNGYLHNDKLIDWTGVPTQIVKRGQNYRIELAFAEP